MSKFEDLIYQLGYYNSVYIQCDNGEFLSTLNMLCANVTNDTYIDPCQLVLIFSSDMPYGTVNMKLFGNCQTSFPLVVPVEPEIVRSIMDNARSCLIPVTNCNGEEVVF